MPVYEDGHGLVDGDRFRFWIGIELERGEACDEGKQRPRNTFLSSFSDFLCFLVLLALEGMLVGEVGMSLVGMSTFLMEFPMRRVHPQVGTCQCWENPYQ